MKVIRQRKFYATEFRVTYCIENKNLLKQKDIQSTRCRADTMELHRKIAGMAYYIRICFFCFVITTHCHKQKCATRLFVKYIESECA